MSIPKLAAQIPTEADAYLKLEELRWNGHPACPHCGVVDFAWYIRPLNGTSRKTRTGSMSQRRVWKCGACRTQFSVLTGTIFQGSKIPVRTWLLVIFEMCASKNGVSAREIERKYELTAKTAWFMLHRIREAMKRDPLATLLRGRSCPTSPESAALPPIATATTRASRSACPALPTRPPSCP
jgi:transposase-like protein